MTNYERIKEMTTDNMASFLLEAVKNYDGCYRCCRNDCRCILCVADWLLESEWDT